MADFLFNQYDDIEIPLKLIRVISNTSEVSKEMG
jgi:hypothetical protein